MTDFSPLSNDARPPQTYDPDTARSGASQSHTAQPTQSVTVDACYEPGSEPWNASQLSDGESALVAGGDVRSQRLQTFLRQQMNDQSVVTDPATAKATDSPARNHAERTKQSEARGPTARVGTNSTGDVDYAEAALDNGRVRDGSGVVDFGSVYAQRGVQNEAGATALRVEVGDDGSHIATKAFETEAHLGIHNPDGSRGVNAGATATLINAEVRVSDGANEATLGIGVGWGAEGSIGLRDADDDGHDELCARATVGPLAVGACIEPDGWMAALRRF